MGDKSHIEDVKEQSEEDGQVHWPGGRREGKGLHLRVEMEADGPDPHSVQAELDNLETGDAFVMKGGVLVLHNRALL